MAFWLQKAAILSLERSLQAHRRCMSRGMFTIQQDRVRALVEQCLMLKQMWTRFVAR